MGEHDNLGVGLLVDDALQGLLLPHSSNTGLQGHVQDGLGVGEGEVEGDLVVVLRRHRDGRVHVPDEEAHGGWRAVHIGVVQLIREVFPEESGDEGFDQPRCLDPVQDHAHRGLLALVRGLVVVKPPVGRVELVADINGEVGRLDGLGVAGPDDLDGVPKERVDQGAREHIVRVEGARVGCQQHARECHCFSCRDSSVDHGVAVGV